MSGLVYQDQSALSLCHTVIEGGVDMENFHVLKTLEVVRGNLKARLSIIGASHVAVFSWPGFKLTEIFACIDASKMGKVIHFHKQTQQSLSLTEHFEGAFRYEFQSEIRTKDEDKGFIAVLEESLKRNDGLVCEFPQGNLPDKPKTIIALRGKFKEELTILTAHSYPNERLNVYTETTVRRMKCS